MFASRMLLRVPGRPQTLYLGPQLRAFSITRIALDPAKKAVPPPPPPPPPAPAPKRTIKAAPAAPVKPVRKPRLVLSDKERSAAAKVIAKQKARLVTEKERERERAEKAKAKAKEKAAAVKQREKARLLAKKEKEKERELARKEKEKKKAEKPYPPPPKRPMGPFLLFARQLKPEPGVGVAQSSIAASEEWKTLPDSEKQGYAKTYEESLAKYRANVADWVASLDTAQLSVARVNREPGTRDEAAWKLLPKRPANSYALFLKDAMTRPDMVTKVDTKAEKEAKGDANKLKKLKIGIRGQLAAAEWKALSGKDKQVYEARAADLKANWDKNFGATIAQQKEARSSAMA
ncbi:hypothetical protein FRC10_002225 [Ceratobasidium sp. 414]|nr:hypothetical protein FRC10_002225 [Ceratobasidium sp. 414]